MVVPLRIHAYLKVVPLVHVLGLGVPGATLLLEPALVGSAAVSVPLAIASVFAEVFDVVVYPVLVPVTLTVMVVAASAATS